MQTKRMSKGMMVVKIDLEKAYDRLPWEFIQDTLYDVRLDGVWVRNIMHCVTILLWLSFGMVVSLIISFHPGVFVRVISSLLISLSYVLKGCPI